MKAVARMASLALLMPALTLAAPPRWITSWTASPQRTWGSDFVLPTGVPDVLEDRTVRQVVRLSLGGSRLRVVLSNAYGSDPVAIGAVHVALAAKGSAIVPGSDRKLTFGGATSTRIPRGASIESDAVDLPVASLARVTVSIHLPDRTPITTFHWDARETGWSVSGDQVDRERLDEDTTTTARLFVSAVRVEAAGDAGAVVALGDSTTDGNGATIGADARWPDFLAARLVPRRVAVLNAGISGARLFGDAMGDNAFARLDRDVLSQPHVRTLVVLLGINDIHWPGTAFDRDARVPDAATLIAAYRQLIERAHGHGVRIVGATLMPTEGALAGTPLADYHDERKDAVRRAVNAWMRTSGAFDAVLDFDAVARDPRHPARLRAEVDSGDHLHPGDRGNRLLAESIDLDALLGPPTDTR